MKAIVTHNRHGYKNGLFIVDDVDFEQLSKHSWHLGSNGKYAQTSIKKEGKWINKYIHQLVLYIPEGMEADHIDQNTYNNLRSNLRAVTHQQNLINRPTFKNGSSVFKGVCYKSCQDTWSARIMFNGVSHFLGYFDTETDAAQAYNIAADNLHNIF